MIIHISIRLKKDIKIPSFSELDQFTRIKGKNESDSIITTFITSSLDTLILFCEIYTERRKFLDKIMSFVYTNDINLSRN